MTSDTVWQTKLHARLHDPAEKALVLLRDPAGHEGGTSQALHRELGYDSLPVKDWLDPDNAEVLDRVLFERGIPTTMYRNVRRADWWAAGADRPQWPIQHGGVADWAQVRWTRDPVLIHPLTGRSFDLGSLGDTDISDIKQRSLAHFSRLIIRNDGAVDWRRTLLAFWRFGAELAEEKDRGKLGHLWPLLPADTRVPDHSIWDHLDLTSAFAGAFAADPEGDAALLAVSLGPVQGFIAAARSTSDLWSGSHLLSRLAWEAMKPICERFGPDAILFPRLRGVPQVDLWLRAQMQLPADWFEAAEWPRRATDANPLFAAALPNRFVAVVPASKIQQIVESAAEEVRGWLQRLGADVVERLLQAAGIPGDPPPYAREQMRRQLEGFPEVHWSAVPFSLIRPRDEGRQTDLDTTALANAMAPFSAAAAGHNSGFLASPAWQVLRRGIHWPDNTVFFAPKPGVLYPAVYDLAERALAAAKSAHSFSQLEQCGWRDSLTGENEWLSLSKDELNLTPGRRDHTLWGQIARNKPAWARDGEHLGALSAIKRLWPTIFAEEVGEALGASAAPRFVVSTHTMALAHQLDQWLESGWPLPAALRRELAAVDRVALPRRLVGRHRDHPELDNVRRLPDLLDRTADDEARAGPVRNLVRRALAADRDSAQAPQLETYYALLMLDGDEMGAWLSGDKKCASYRESFHPTVRSGFDERAAGNPLLYEYGRQPRAVSPNRHFAISAALNDFALYAVPEIVEHERSGRVIYAGGDDVLAMLPVSDLIPAMQRLRQVYSGADPATAHLDWREVRRRSDLIVKDGFGLLRGRLLRLMGETATASCGAVIAHHQAPLSAVLGELRAAEARAKRKGGRDAWSLALIKRSGGTLHLTAKWGEPLDGLEAVRAFLTDPGVSRRAVDQTLDWIESLPPDDPRLLEKLLAYQLERQAGSDGARRQAPEVARRSVAIAIDENFRPRSAGAFGWLKDFLLAAEFLAREVRR